MLKADIKRYFNGRINTFTYILYVLTYKKHEILTIIENIVQQFIHYIQ